MPKLKCFVAAVWIFTVALVSAAELDRVTLDRMFKEIADKPVPENLENNVIILFPDMFRESKEYDCKTCHSKTAYPIPNEELNFLNEQRENVKTLQELNLNIVLDESGFCAECSEDKSIFEVAKLPAVVKTLSDIYVEETLTVYVKKDEGGSSERWENTHSALLPASTHLPVFEYNKMEKSYIIKPSFLWVPERCVGEGRIALEDIKPYLIAGDSQSIFPVVKFTKGEKLPEGAYSYCENMAFSIFVPDEIRNWKAVAPFYKSPIMKKIIDCIQSENPEYPLDYFTSKIRFSVPVDQAEVLSTNGVMSRKDGKKPVLYWKITVDGEVYRTISQEYDAELLTAFLTGKDRYVENSGNETSVKESLPRLKELFGSAPEKKKDK